MHARPTMKLLYVGLTRRAVKQQITGFLEGGSNKKSLTLRSTLRQYVIFRGGQFVSHRDRRRTLNQESEP